MIYCLVVVCSLCVVSLARVIIIMNYYELISATGHVVQKCVKGDLLRIFLFQLVGHT